MEEEIPSIWTQVAGYFLWSRPMYISRSSTHWPLRDYNIALQQSHFFLILVTTIALPWARPQELVRGRWSILWLSLAEAFLFLPKSVYCLLFVSFLHQVREFGYPPFGHLNYLQGAQENSPNSQISKEHDLQWVKRMSEEWFFQLDFSVDTILLVWSWGQLTQTSMEKDILGEKPGCIYFYNQRLRLTKSKVEH